MSRYNPVRHVDFTHGDLEVIGNLLDEQGRLTSDTALLRLAVRCYEACGYPTLAASTADTVKAIEAGSTSA